MKCLLRSLLPLFLLLCSLTAAAASATNAVNVITHITVARDGSGDYRTIQEAINALPSGSDEPVTVYIKNGVYHEKLVIPDGITHVSFTGESKEQTIITNGDYSGKLMNGDAATGGETFNTFNSYTLKVLGNDILIENLTIENASGPVGQAVALQVEGDRFVLRNCRVLGNQDTLLTAGNDKRQYYEDCHITGTTDFIFGDAIAVFRRCTIESLKNSYITAASTPQGQSFGYVFLDCKLVADKNATKVYLGRPWRPYAQVVFMGCAMGAHIREEGWHNWGKVTNESTAYYAEYKNTGPGADTHHRVNWSRQLKDREAAAYTLSAIFKDWQPPVHQWKLFIDIGADPAALPPQTSWGSIFIKFMDTSITRVYDKLVIDSLETGSLVLMQPNQQSAKQLTAQLQRIRQRGAVPVLLTPPLARSFTDGGAVAANKDGYADLLRAVAKDNQVVLVDLAKASRQLLESYGPQRSQWLYNYLQPGEHPNYPAGAADDVHFSELGARKLAEWVYGALQSSNPGNIDLYFFTPSPRK